MLNDPNAQTFIVLGVSLLIILWLLYRIRKEKGKSERLMESILTDVEDRVMDEIKSSYPSAVVCESGWEMPEDPKNPGHFLRKKAIRIEFERSDVPLGSVKIVLNEDLLVSIEGYPESYAFPKGINSLLAKIRHVINEKFFTPR
ncbi:MAG: hypothetical protein WC565_02180 [Parcubacteria group bacterium]